MANTAGFLSQGIEWLSLWREYHYAQYRSRGEVHSTGSRFIMNKWAKQSQKLRKCSERKRNKETLPMLYVIYATYYEVELQHSTNTHTHKVPFRWQKISRIKHFYMNVYIPHVCKSVCLSMVWYNKYWNCRVKCAPKEHYNVNKRMKESVFCAVLLMITGKTRFFCVSIATGTIIITTTKSTTNRQPKKIRSKIGRVQNRETQQSWFELLYGIVVFAFTFMFTGLHALKIMWHQRESRSVTRKPITRFDFIFSTRANSEQKVNERDCETGKKGRKVRFYIENLHKFVSVNQRTIIYVIDRLHRTSKIHLLVAYTIEEKNAETFSLHQLKSKPNSTELIAIYIYMLNCTNTQTQSANLTHINTYQTIIIIMNSFITFRLFHFVFRWKPQQIVALFLFCSTSLQIRFH